MKKSRRISDREDGRIQLLLLMKPDLVRKLKAAALEADVHTYELVEEILVEYLERNVQPNRS